MLRFVLFALAVCKALAAAKCCWSHWGDAKTCGGYPSYGSGGLCNTDYTTKCSGNTKCPAVPPSPPGPGPTPPAPTPPSPPSPAPTPPAPTPPLPPPSGSAHVFQNAVFNVKVTNDVTYGQGLTCTQNWKASSCKPMDLKLDIYEPVGRQGGAVVPASKPAYVLMHGGGNFGGSKGGINVMVGKWWASRGFVVFDINYRLYKDKGLLPPKKTGLLGAAWAPAWPSAYPATRDAKAAIRFVRANAGTYGIDIARVASSGGSAGATDMLAGGVTFEEDFKDELTVAEDATLASTHLNFSSAVQCLVLHWPSDGGISLAQQQYPAKGDRYRSANPVAISFHGDQDTTIPIEHSYAVQAAYKKTGVPFYMHVLKNCPHGSWCYDGKGHCLCSGAKWSPLMEELAFPVMVSPRALNLTVVGSAADDPSKYAVPDALLV